MLQQLMHNIAGNLFKPLLLFFYAGFLIPILRVKFEFPKPVYQALTIFLLLSIGWHGGGELAHLHSKEVTQAAGFMLLGFFTNLTIGFATYFILSRGTRLRKIDSATVAGYYGSDSAGTFVTALGVLTATHVAFAPYMPVLLAVMEIPGCLVALYLVNRLRERGMDAKGNMPGEVGFSLPQEKLAQSLKKVAEFEEEELSVPEFEEELVGASGLDEHAAVHHIHPLAHAGDDAEVVGDQDEAHPAFLLKIGQKLHDLGLHGHIQGSGRLVANEQLRPAAHGDGNHHTLLLANAELVRVALHLAFGVGQFHLAKPIHGFSFCLRPGQFFVNQQGLHHLLATAEHRI